MHYINMVLPCTLSLVVNVCHTPFIAQKCNDDGTFDVRYDDGQEEDGMLAVHTGLIQVCVCVYVCLCVMLGY